MILKTENIYKTYKHLNNTLHVLKGISLNINKGDVVSIIGPSGAGKSTLLHIMGGLDVPDEGQVFIEDEDVYSLNDVKRAKLRNSKIGFVFQSYHLFPEFTALENIVIPLLIRDNQKKIKKYEPLGLELLKQVGLSRRATHKPQELSGGEQQRVAIARALVNQPIIVFCDEPTGNLDSESGKEIINLLMDLNKKNKQTLVIVTHDETVANRSTHKIHMRDGLLASK